MPSAVMIFVSGILKNAPMILTTKPAAPRMAAPLTKLLVFFDIRAPIYYGISYALYYKQRHLPIFWSDFIARGINRNKKNKNGLLVVYSREVRYNHYIINVLEKRKMLLNIVLVEPEIPANTGNIARTCAVTGAQLHLVEPLGFSIADKHLKRAGLDYWPHLNVIVHKDLDAFFANTEGVYYYCSKKASRYYHEVSFEDGCYLLFGKETKGLPEDLIFSHQDSAIRIPMKSGMRSLNLSNAVGIIAYEALRQNGFAGLG
jgi:tRNA (cytidine/uridine-2'-O-)-methyltransferase